MNIFISNVNGESNILLYTEIDVTLSKVENFLKTKMHYTYDDIYCIEQNEIQYYCIDERCWFKERECKLLEENY